MWNEIAACDTKMSRNRLLAKRFAPTTINGMLISLMVLFDPIAGTNPSRHLTMIDAVEPAPMALCKTGWNAVHRSVEAAGGESSLGRRGAREAQSNGTWAGKRGA